MRDHRNEKNIDVVVIHLLPTIVHRNETTGKTIQFIRSVHEFFRLFRKAKERSPSNDRARTATPNGDTHTETTEEKRPE